MTDTERARAFLDAQLDPGTGREALVRELAAAFAAARLDERAAIVTLLRDRSFWSLPATLERVADHIEAGEHEEAGS